MRDVGVVDGVGVAVNVGVTVGVDVAVGVSVGVSVGEAGGGVGVGGEGHALDWVSATSTSTLVSVTWSNQKPRCGPSTSPRSVPNATLSWIVLPARPAEPRAVAENELDASTIFSATRRENAGGAPARPAIRCGASGREHPGRKRRRARTP